jgi:predicted dehydrogenase
MIMARLRIGFVGAGTMGQCAHLRNYANLDDCEVVALAELRPGLRAAVARRYDIAASYASGEAMLAAEQLDGIVASQPFTHHGSILPPLLEAGVPLFTEKPLASSIAVGEDLLAALAASGTWHMVGYHKRSDPAVMAARAEIDRLQKTGELGKLTYVRITMPAGDWIAGGFHEMIRSEEPVPGSPADAAAADMDAEAFGHYVSFVNYYIHQVNLLRHLLGEAYTATFVDKAGTMLVGETAGGATGVIEMSPYVTSIDWQETALVCFEKGWIRIELPAPVTCNRPGQVTYFSDPGDVTPTTTSPTLPWVHAMRQQALNFCAAIRGDAPPPCDAAEALEDLKVARDYLRLHHGA